MVARASRDVLYLRDTDGSIVDPLDKIAARWRDARPGLTVNRCDVARVLLQRGIEQELARDSETPRPAGLKSAAALRPDRA